MFKVIISVVMLVMMSSDCTRPELVSKMYPTKEMRHCYFYVKSNADIQVFVLLSVSSTI